MDESIREKIITRLQEIEKEHNVRVLYAVESGSRAWGLESSDSDYDIRFIYMHTSEWYLNILPKRDVIEYPIIDIFDYSGWDIRKVLFLMNKSNPVLFEWLISPIVYMYNEGAYNLILEASGKYYSPVTSIYHYLHMAKCNNRDYLHGEIVKVKKYFYVLRPLFACIWIEKNNTPPPVEFEKLMQSAGISRELENAVRELIAKKRSGCEMGLERRIPVINDFINQKIEYFEKHDVIHNLKNRPTAAYLDEKFVEILKL